MNSQVHRLFQLCLNKNPPSAFHNLWIVTKTFLLQSATKGHMGIAKSAYSLSSLVLREALRAFKKLLYKNKQYCLTY